MDRALNLIDSHCHLQDERLADNLDAVVAEARGAGVGRVVCCGSCEEDWPKVLDIQRKYPDFIIASFGLHPWCIKERSANYLKTLDDYMRDSSSVVGEIGLDFAIPEFNAAEQEEVFMAQLDLALRHDRPVSVHCRKAWESLLTIFSKEKYLKVRGSIHSYSGSKDFVSSLLKTNLSFSFSGSITRSNNKKGHESLRQVPPERLLVETDAPDLAPTGTASPVNTPANLPLVVKAVARILEKTEEDIARLTARNAIQIFARTSER